MIFGIKDKKLAIQLMMFTVCQKFVLLCFFLILALKGVFATCVRKIGCCFIRD